MKFMYHAEAYDDRGRGIMEPWGDQEVYADFTEERWGGPDEQYQAAREWAQRTFQHTPRAQTVQISIYAQEHKEPWRYYRSVATIERTEPAER